MDRCPIINNTLPAQHEFEPEKVNNSRGKTENGKKKEHLENFSSKKKKK